MLFKCITRCLVIFSVIGFISGTMPSEGGLVTQTEDIFFATGDFDTGDIYVYRSNGDGTFSSRITIGNIEGRPCCITVADYDNDSDLDVTVQSFQGDSFLFKNNGDLTFSRSIIAQGLYYDWTYESAAGDFNNDSYCDFVTSSGGNFLYVFLNNKNDTFSANILEVPFITYPPSENLLGMDCGDFNEDGNMDIISVVYSSAQDEGGWLFLGKGDGTFKVPESPAFMNTWNNGRNGVPWGDNPACFSGDFNGDGHLDVIVGQDDDGDPGQAWLLVGDGAGAFVFTGEAYDANPVVETGGNAAGGGISDTFDFNNDGYLDVVSAVQRGQGLIFLKGLGNGVFENWVQVDGYVSYIIAAPPLQPTSIDVTVDIKPGSYPNSINLGSQGSVPVAILSTATFDATTINPLTITLASAPVRLKGKGTPMASVEDINDDGLLDLIVHVDTSSLALSPTDEYAVLEGRTFSGLMVRGKDTVRIVNE